MQNQDENTSITPPEEAPIVDEIDTQSQLASSENPAGTKRSVGRIIGFGILAIFILGALGALGGYFTALQDRENYADSVISTEIADQFLLGLIEFERGQYEVARQRFEYILRIDPNNPAAREKLTETILKLNENDALPTAAPTPTLTPTPDSRDLTELYNTALTYRDAENWTALIETLDTLRYKDPEFNAVKIDGLYYLAYRNRGMARIQVEGNLEGGIFDLNRAELFGLLDIEAKQYREWATSYITGVSFWEVDWQMVVKYFSPLAVSAPYLSDSNFFTSQDRLATAQVEINLIDLEAARYRYTVKQWCDAYDLFAQVNAIIQLSPEDLAKFEDSRNKCLGLEPETTQEP